MLSVKGTYENGTIQLDRKVDYPKKLKVIVTFLDETSENSKKRLTTGDFSFNTSRKKTGRFKGSVSDAVIEERRAQK